MLQQQMSRLVIGGENHLLEATLDQTSEPPTLSVTRRHDIGEMPSFISFSQERRLALCVAEGSNTLSSFSVDAEGSLEHLSRVACPGGPAYCSFDLSGRWAFSASYGSGETRIYEVDERGTLKEAQVTLGTGKYTHCAQVTPNNKLLVVPSKGSDTLALIRFNPETGGAEQLAPVTAPKGSGPRHVVFTKNGARAYVSGENDCSLIIYSIKGESFTQIAHLPSLPGGQQEGDTGSDVHLSEDERFVYLSNRGDDSISRFEVTESGTRFVDHLSTEGNVPRNFCLGSQALIAANQESNSLALYTRDTTTGALSLTGVVATDERPFWVGSARST